MPWKTATEDAKTSTIPNRGHLSEWTDLRTSCQGTIQGMNQEQLGQAVAIALTSGLPRQSCIELRAQRLQRTKFQVYRMDCGNCWTSL